MTFEEFMKEHPHWNIVDEHLAKIVWQACQSEIDELKSRISELEEKNRYYKQLIHTKYGYPTEELI